MRVVFFFLKAAHSLSFLLNGCPGKDMHAPFFNLGAEEEDAVLQETAHHVHLTLAHVYHGHSRWHGARVCEKIKQRGKSSVKNRTVLTCAVSPFLVQPQYDNSATLTTGKRESFKVLGFRLLSSGFLRRGSISGSGSDIRTGERNED